METEQKVLVLFCSVAIWMFVQLQPKSTPLHHSLSDSHIIDTIKLKKQRAVPYALSKILSCSLFVVLKLKSIKDNILV